MSTPTPGSPLLSLDLNRQGTRSLQSQIFDQVRDAILSGRLAPGTRLPPSRTLASDNEVSRNTVLGAFDRLLAEGYVEGKRGSGTRVSNVLPDDLLATRSDPDTGRDNSAPAGKLSGLVRGLKQHTFQSRHSAKGVRAFRPGLPDLENFPFQVWSRITSRFWRHPPRDLLAAGELAGYLPLRQSIAPIWVPFAVSSVQRNK